MLLFIKTNGLNGNVCAQKFDSYKKCPKSYYLHSYYTYIEPSKCRIVVDLNKDLLPNNANLDFSDGTDCLHLEISVQKGDILGLLN